MLPVDVLPGLMVTLPAMLQSALDEILPDHSFRIVQRPETRRPARGDRIVLKPGTSESFEVASAIHSGHLGHPGAALLKAAHATNPILVRRPD